MTATVATDAAIVLASRTDPQAFAGLFDRHAPRVHRYLPAGSASRPPPTSSGRRS